MARWIIGKDDYQPKPTKQPEPHKAVQHGKPRWGYAFKRGKGGQAVQPEYMVVSDRDIGRIQRAQEMTQAAKSKFINLSAATALKHAITMPGMELAGKRAERATLIAMLRNLDTAEANQRNAASRKADDERRVKLAFPESSNVIFCGDCGKPTDGKVTLRTHRAHAEDCPQRRVIWEQLKETPAFAVFVHKRKAIKDALWEAIKAQENAATNAKATTVPDEFNASDVALSAAAQDARRVQYVKASDYSDQHK